MQNSFNCDVWSAFGRAEMGDVDPDSLQRECFRRVIMERNGLDNHFYLANQGRRGNIRDSQSSYTAFELQNLLEVRFIGDVGAVVRDTQLLLRRGCVLEVRRRVRNHSSCGSTWLVWVVGLGAGMPLCRPYFVC